MKQQIDVTNPLNELEEIHAGLHKLEIAVIKARDSRIAPYMELQLETIQQKTQELAGVVRMQRRIQGDEIGIERALAFKDRWGNPKESVTEAVRGWGRKLWRSAQIAEKANGLLMAGRELKVT